MEEFPGIIPEVDTAEEEVVETSTEKKKKKRSVYELLSETPAEEVEQIKDNQPAERIAKEEKPVVYEAYVEGREDVLAEQVEHAPAGSSEEAQLLVNAAFLENIHDQLQDEAAVEIDLDALMQETLAEFELPEPTDEQIEDIWEEGAEIPLADLAADDEPVLVPPTTPPTSPPPPRPPHPPTSSGPPGPPPSSGPPAPISSPRAVPGSPRTPDVVSSSIDRRPNAAGYFFLGGIVGYLIGRRRGRIRSEKQLLPVQEKLEQQVTELQNEIIRREATLRDIVRTQVEKYPEKQSVIVERVERQQRSSKEKHADAFHKPDMQPGRIGRFALERSTPKEAAPERANAALQLHELLAIAERIEVEHVNVRKLYEAGRIDYQTLKEIVAEYLQGGDFERMLKHQLRPERLTSTTQLGAHSLRGSEQGDLQNPSQHATSLPSHQKHDPSGHHFTLRHGKKQSSYATRISIVSAGVLLTILLLVAGTLFLLGVL